MTPNLPALESFLYVLHQNFGYVLLAKVSSIKEILLRFNHKTSKGYTEYVDEGPSVSPVIRHHYQTGEITLISPGNEKNQVTLFGTEDSGFVLRILKRIEASNRSDEIIDQGRNVRICFSPKGQRVEVRRQYSQNYFFINTPQGLRFCVLVLSNLLANASK